MNRYCWDFPLHFSRWWQVRQKAIAASCTHAGIATKLSLIVLQGLRRLHCTINFLLLYYHYQNSKQNIEVLQTWMLLNLNSNTLR